MPQRRRLNAETFQTNALNDPTAADTTIVLDETQAVNVHGYRFCGSIEPENTDANCNGWWIVYCFPAGILNVNTGGMPTSFASLDDEDFLPYVWGVGCFTASNQAPYHFEFNPRTSRTCQKGARLIGTIVLEGISAGMVRINTVMTCFTS